MSGRSDTTKRAAAELIEAKCVLARSREIACITVKDVANALNCPEVFARHCMEPSQVGDHMRVADLLLLAKQPAMRVFVDEVLTAIRGNFDQRHLRVSDLEALSVNTATADLARIALRPVVARLWPELTTDTSAQSPADSG